MASVASQLIEEATAHAQSDSLEDEREICTDSTYFPNNLHSAQRQARKLISGPSPSTKTRVLSFNSTLSRVVTGLLAGLNTLRNLYLIGLINNPTYSKCDTAEETSVTFYVSVKLWLHSDMHIWAPSWTLRILRI